MEELEGLEEGRLLTNFLATAFAVAAGRPLVTTNEGQILIGAPEVTEGECVVYLYTLAYAGEWVAWAV